MGLFDSVKKSISSAYESAKKNSGKYTGGLGWGLVKDNVSIGGQSLNDLVMGTGPSVSDPYESAAQAAYREKLSGLSNGLLGGYKPDQAYTNANDAYGQYQNVMKDSLAGKLNSGYEQQLSSIRDNNIANAQSQIQNASGLASGGLLSNLANRGVLNSSVTTNGLSQIDKNATNTMANVINSENANYAQNYLSGLTNQTQTGQGLLAGTLGYNQALQDYAFGTLPYESSYYAGQSPIVNQGSAGLLGSLIGGAGSALGSAAGPALVAALSDRNLKEGIEYTGEFFDGVPVAYFKYKGSTEWYKGLIAQDVQELYPDRVIKEHGVLYVLTNMFSDMPEDFYKPMTEKPEKRG